MKRLVFREWPYAIWISGTIILILSLYLLYHLLFASGGSGFLNAQGEVWQYLVAIAILMMGVLFLFAGTIEKVIFDKEVRWCFLQVVKMIFVERQSVCREHEHHLSDQDPISLDGAHQGRYDQVTGLRESDHQHNPFHHSN